MVSSMLGRFASWGSTTYTATPSMAPRPGSGFDAFDRDELRRPGARAAPHLIDQRLQATRGRLQCRPGGPRHRDRDEPHQRGGQDLRTEHLRRRRDGPLRSDPGVGAGQEFGDIPVERACGGAGFAEGKLPDPDPSLRVEQEPAEPQIAMRDAGPAQTLDLPPHVVSRSGDSSASSRAVHRSALDMIERDHEFVRTDRFQHPHRGGPDAVLGRHQRHHRLDGERSSGRGVGVVVADVLQPGAPVGAVQGIGAELVEADSPCDQPAIVTGADQQAPFRPGRIVEPGDPGKVHLAAMQRIGHIGEPDRRRRCGRRRPSTGTQRRRRVRWRERRRSGPCPTWRIAPPSGTRGTPTPAGSTAPTVRCSPPPQRPRNRKSSTDAGKPADRTAAIDSRAGEFVPLPVDRSPIEMSPIDSSGSDADGSAAGSTSCNSGHRNHGHRDGNGAAVRQPGPDGGGSTATGATRVSVNSATCEISTTGVMSTIGTSARASTRSPTNPDNVRRPTVASSNPTTPDEEEADQSPAVDGGPARSLRRPCRSLPLRVTSAHVRPISRPSGRLWRARRESSAKRKPTRSLPTASGSNLASDRGAADQVTDRADRISCQKIPTDRLTAPHGAARWRWR